MNLTAFEQALVSLKIVQDQLFEVCNNT